MQPRIHVITLAVSDLARALAFYRDGLGLASAGVFGTEFIGDKIHPAGAIATFQLHGGLILALYPRTELAKDALVPFGPPKTGEFSLGYAVGSKEEVDAVLGQAAAAGATMTGRPTTVHGAFTRAISEIPTGTCGRSCGIRTWRASRAWAWQGGRHALPALRPLGADAAHPPARRPLRVTLARPLDDRLSLQY